MCLSVCNVASSRSRRSLSRPAPWQRAGLNEHASRRRGRRGIYGASLITPAPRFLFSVFPVFFAGNREAFQEKQGEAIEHERANTVRDYGVR